MSGYAPTNLDTQIEQAIAFGRSLDWITTNLHVTTGHVDHVLRRLDLINATEDNDQPVQFPPASPETVRELIDAICPRKKATA